MQTQCTDRFERQLLREGYRLIAGVDEVGRGALAGPVVAGAVILDLGRIPQGLDDSKKLTRLQRERLDGKIRESALAIGLGQVDAEGIDRINILQATREAMRLAIAALDPAPHALLLDAIKLDEVSLPQVPIIKGDSLSVSIAAASIVAKVARDRMMREFGERFPGYGFASHVGYGTSEHLAALAKLGPAAIHRQTFRGVRREPDQEKERPKQKELSRATGAGSNERTKH